MRLLLALSLLALAPGCGILGKRGGELAQRVSDDLVAFQEEQLQSEAALQAKLDVIKEATDAGVAALDAQLAAETLTPQEHAAAVNAVHAESLSATATALMARDARLSAATKKLGEDQKANLSRFKDDFAGDIQAAWGTAVAVVKDVGGAAGGAFGFGTIGTLLLGGLGGAGVAGAGALAKKKGTPA